MNFNFTFKNILLIFLSTLFSTVINVPGDYPTIQGALDAAQDGDIIEVGAGTYTENINYNGKNIVVGSLYLTTQDTSYISSTVIDGNHSGPVVTFMNEENRGCGANGFDFNSG